MKIFLMKSFSRPEINAGSMADIAFLLLVFFLVVTTIESDTGMFRKLSPMQDIKSQKVNKRNVLHVWVNSQDEIMVNGDVIPMEKVFEVSTRFIANPNNLETLPQKEVLHVPLLGKMAISKQVISIQNDENTSYGRYIQVQNELARAYTYLRDELSKERFQKTYSELIASKEMEKVKAIRKVFPMRISEASPIVTQR